VGTRWQWLKGPRRKTHAEKLAFAILFHLGGLDLFPDGLRA